MAFTREQLERLSDDQLKQLMAKRKNDAAKADVFQLGIKVTLNSAYGMIGNEYSRYFDVRIAEGITVSGQLSIRWVERKLDEYLNKVLGTKGLKFAVAGDTDSIYITLAPLVEKFFPDAPKEKVVKALDKLCEQKIKPVIDDAYKELAEYMNAYDQRMNMTREVIADRGLWRAKKNYALNVWNSEGVAYDEPKLKIMGIESTRSSTPAICRDAIKEAIRLIMTGTESDVQKFVASFKKTFWSAPLEKISGNSGINDIEKWFQKEGFAKGTPWRVKAAIAYNRLVDEFGTPGIHTKIRSGDKVRLINLKKANPTRNNVLAYPDEFPTEFEMEKFVDKKTQWEKVFLGPVESLTKLIGWSTTKKRTLF